MGNRLTEHAYIAENEKFFFKESLLFETQDDQEWLVTYDGRIVRLYNMQNGKYPGDRYAELCGTKHISAEEYFEFLDNRSSSMVKFACELLFTPVTD